MKDICIKKFETELEAELSKNLLDPHGIKSAVQKDSVHMPTGIPVSNLGASLYVLEIDAEKAKDILESTPI